MILAYSVQILKTYLPILLSVTYLFSLEKQRIENILKFLLIRAFLSCFEYFALTFFNFSETSIQLTLLPIYFYFTLFHYAYSLLIYDLIFAPILNIFVDYHTDLINQIDREKNRIKVLEQHGKIKVGEVQCTDFLNRFQKLIFKIFNVDNMYLLK